MSFIQYFILSMDNCFGLYVYMHLPVMLNQIGRHFIVLGGEKREKSDM